MIMDSQWISLRVGGGVNNNDQQNNAANENLDLTLKLGLPNSDNDQNQDQRFDMAPNMAPYGLANQNFHDQNYTQGMNSHIEMGYEGRLMGRNSNIGGQTFHNDTDNPLFGMNSHIEMGYEGRPVERGNSIGGQTFHSNTDNHPLFVWPTPNDVHGFGMNPHIEMGYEGRQVERGNNIGGQTFHNNTNPPLFVWPPPEVQPNHVHGFAGQFSGYSPAVPVDTNLYHPQTNFMMNPTHHMMPTPLPPPPPPPPPPLAMNDYTLLDHIPMKRVKYVPQNASSSLGAGGSGRRAGTMRQLNNINPYMRCTNYNCNTNNTPLWRNGPLGPKTLCNACGIMYKKEEAKKKANEAASSSGSHGEESNN